jgi:pyruvate/2-oxoglutarate dehydrogenase complex dihydrolipoamide acyltransferase (E2) component
MEMTEGTILTWRKEVGQVIQKGEPIAEIETDKVTSDLESPYAGLLARILVAEGTVVRVGTPLALIAQPGEDIADIDNLVGPTDSTLTEPRREVARSHGAHLQAAPAAQGIQVEPAARRLAAELGVDLSTVVGTGPAGRITVDDVRALAP